MAMVYLDSQIFYTPLPAAKPKPTHRSLLARNGGISTTVSEAHLTLPPPPPPPPQEAGGPRQDEVVEISSDGESNDDDLDDGQSRQQAEPGSVAGAGKGINTTPGTNGNNDTKKPSVTGGSNPDDKYTSTQQQPELLSASPGALQTQYDSRPSTQSGGKNSNRDGAMCPDPTDHAAWDKRYPFSLAALGRRKLAELAKESACKPAVSDYPEPALDSVRRAQSPGSAASNHGSETQQRPTSRHLSQRHNQGDSNQTSDPEHRHPLVLENREQNEEGSDVPLQAEESQASILTLLDNESIDLGGLPPNTIATIQQLQRRWRARGKDETEPSLDEELRSRGSGRADVETDNRSPAISDNYNKNNGNIVPSQGYKRRRMRVHQPHYSSETRFGEEGDKVIGDSDRSRDRNACGDKHFAPSHNGRAGAQDRDADEEDNVQPPTAKRQKPNRHPPEAEPPAKPKPGRSRRRRLACRRDDNARAEDEENDDACQPPSKRRRGSSLARSTVLRPATRRHLHSDDAPSRSQRVRTSASGRKRSDRHSVLSSPSSQKSIDRKATFEEWPLGNAVLKRVTVGGMATFQVEFTWDSCATHGRKDRATEDPHDTYPVRGSPSLRRGGAAGLHFTPEDALIELTDDDAQSPPLTEEEAEWEFERILGTRKRGRGNQVLVKWTHFEKPTWEPMKNFLGTEALHAYRTQHGNIAP
ncbi:hypothetical protein E0Z10_g4337 [Xylaria hypoxylon]|uniref:Chromo domain-containing protein n=1 Tax=Xylaria hypoxylon TaxID=37992 RepID=A0A4Z0YLE2_9PEZI|nr:hypothetical protein E0Z10_g4337 [Xylaria hypoxylon]